MNTPLLTRIVFVLALVHTLLTAQPLHDPVPLRHWPAPLYWQPVLADSRRLAVTPTDPNPLLFIAMTPCRVVDTRAGSGFSGPFGPPSLMGGVSRTFPLPSSTVCSIPATAQAYSLNITVVPPGFLGYITVWPAGQPQPFVSTLNDLLGTVVANAAIVPAGAGGSINVYASNTTDLVIDINGYYASPTDLNGNTATGSNALFINTTGSFNTATGINALVANSSGSLNTATGSSALSRNTTGSNNIAIGVSAAINVSGDNSNNIHIGTGGASADNGTIRIGGNLNLGDSAAQTSFFVAGVAGATVSGVPVLINTATGQLGVASSSRRYKEDIQDMGDASNGLMRLRPVTFRYQKPFADGSKPIQYGLIAEEVAEVYPDLVAHSADGQIETVKYQVLDSMLLNEVQRLNKENQALQERLSRLEAVMANVARGAGVQ